MQVYDRTQQKLLATGKLTTIDNQIDTTSGTVKLRAEFENRDGMLFANQFVNTRLLVNTLTNQTLIPSSAIQHNGTKDFVYPDRQQQGRDADGEGRVSRTTATQRSRESRLGTWWPTAALRSCRTDRRSRSPRSSCPLPPMPPESDVP